MIESHVSVYAKVEIITIEVLRRQTRPDLCIAQVPSFRVGMPGCRGLRNSGFRVYRLRFRD